MKDTAASLFKDQFRTERSGKGPRLGMTERDALQKHVTDLGLWVSVLDSEVERMTALGKNARRYPLAWLIKNYLNVERTYREIETPPDSLTTHRTPEMERPVQTRTPQALRDLIDEHLVGIRYVTRGSA